MAVVDFRCDHCGKLLSVDGHPGATVQCPQCQGSVTIPVALASLPRPHVPPGDLAPQAPTLAGGPPPQSVLNPPAPPNPTAAFMPWVLSFFLHVGLVLIMAFGTMVYYKTTEKEKLDVFIPGEVFSETPGGVINPGEGGPSPEARQSVRRTQATGYGRHEATIVGSVGGGGKTISMIGLGGGGPGPAGGGMAKFGIGPGGSGRMGPRSSFFGSGGNAHHVIFLIDRSGSMTAAGVFDIVRKQMLVSIGRLSEVQDFHVIFFADGPPIENRPKRLVDATRAYKADVVRWMEEVIAEGQTDPIPALMRAFDVMDRADPGRKGKQIFMLTDGRFKDNVAVLAAIKKRNVGKEVHINTYLYGSDNDQETVDVMKAIAAENGGLFKIVGNE